MADEPQEEAQGDPGEESVKSNETEVVDDDVTEISTYGLDTTSFITRDDATIIEDHDQRPSMIGQPGEEGEEEEVGEQEEFQGAMGEEEEEHIFGDEQELEELGFEEGEEEEVSEKLPEVSTEGEPSISDKPSGASEKRAKVTIEGQPSKKKSKAAKKAALKKKAEQPPSEERFAQVTHRVSGDFAALDTDILLGAQKSIESIASYLSASKESSSVEEEVVEEVREPIDREFYFNLYSKYRAERNAKKIKNNLLHRKMAEYFRKRRMEHVLKETDNQVDSQQKYEKRLDELDNLKDIDKRERDSITADLDDMRNQRNDNKHMLNSHFHHMQQREKDIGSAVVNTKTGKQLPEKVLERLIKRQKDKWEEVAGLRLSFIKIRNKVAEKKEALHALDYVGENLHLIDYEQLKIENQSHIDKIEERDEELTKLRAKCSETIQCLAHLREKSAACQLDYQNFQDQLLNVQSDLNECRENLNDVKQQRDLCRSTTRTLIEDAGLLTKPILLLDMEKSLNEIKIQSQHLAKLKKENSIMQRNLVAIKRNIANTTPKIQKSVVENKTRKPSQAALYKGRPTLICPDLPSLHDEI